MLNWPVQEEYFFDHATGDVIIRRYQDAEPIIEANLEAQGAFAGFGKRDFTPVANVPLALIDKWMLEGLNFYDPEQNAYIIKHKLNSNEYQGLRCFSGQITEKA
jgi:hypothetical protein